MDDLISRSDLMAQVVRKKSEVGAKRHTEGFNDAILRVRSMIHSAKAINAVPVVHARWIDEIEPNAVTSSGKEVHFFRCSACNFTWNNKTAVLNYFRFCPNCGARMDGETNDPH